VADVALALPSEVPMVHVGGETIPCTLRDGLRMCVPPCLDRALAGKLADDRTVSRLEDRRFAYLTPARERIAGIEREWPYRFFYGQGASTLSAAADEVKTGVAEALQGARWVTARDPESVRFLQGAGVSSAAFSWDLGVLTPVLLGGGSTALETLNDVRRRGDLLVHANAHFLEEHGEELARAIAALSSQFSSVTVGLAGLAANHDSIVSAARLAEMLRGLPIPVHFDGELHAGRIAARIRDASCVISTSLHYRILAMTFGVPRVSLPNAKVAN